MDINRKDKIVIHFSMALTGIVIGIYTRYVTQFILQEYFPFDPLELFIEIIAEFGGIALFLFCWYYKSNEAYKEAQQATNSTLFLEADPYKMKNVYGETKKQYFMFQFKEAFEIKLDLKGEKASKFTSQEFYQEVERALKQSKMAQKIFARKRLLTSRGRIEVPGGETEDGSGGIKITKKKLERYNKELKKLNLKLKNKRIKKPQYKKQLEALMDKYGVEGPEGPDGPMESASKNEVEIDDKEEKKLRSVLKLKNALKKLTESRELYEKGLKEIYEPFASEKISIESYENSLLELTKALFPDLLETVKATDLSKVKEEKINESLLKYVDNAIETIKKEIENQEKEDKAIQNELEKAPFLEPVEEEEESEKSEDGEDFYDKLHFGKKMHNFDRDLNMKFVDDPHVYLLPLTEPEHFQDYIIEFDYLLLIMNGSWAENLQFPIQEGGSWHEYPVSLRLCRSMMLHLRYAAPNIPEAFLHSSEEMGEETLANALSADQIVDIDNEVKRIIILDNRAKLEGADYEIQKWKVFYDKRTKSLKDLTKRVKLLTPGELGMNPLEKVEKIRDLQRTTQNYKYITIALTAIVGLLLIVVMFSMFFSIPSSNNEFGGLGS